MKIHSMGIANVLSFKDMPETEFNPYINIFIGPNRGGKSNFLDILSIILKKYFIKTYSVNISKDSRNIKDEGSYKDENLPLKKYYNDDRAQIIILNFTLENRDYEKILEIFENNDKIIEEIHKYKSEPSSIYKSFKSEDISDIKDPDIMKYIITIDNEPPRWTRLGERLFYFYLRNHFLNELFSLNIEEMDIKPIFLYFPPYRNQNEKFSIQLSSQDYLISRTSYSKSFSKKGSSITTAALSIIAEKRRRYEVEKNTEDLWNSDPAIRELREMLRTFNYDFKLQLSDHIRNWYDFIIIKNSKEHKIEDSSSGEKEIFNFLLGITAFNVRDGIIIIDEPELHLHPSWQKKLMEIIIKIARERNIQFFISTHSPSLITSDTIEFVHRVYEDENGSNIVTPRDIEAIVIKDLVHLVNTQNNEKIFFGEIVVLVEGISDRIVFKTLIEIYSRIFNISKSIEIVEVHGKTNFIKYRNLLDKYNITNNIIADFDYVKNIADSDLKRQFSVDQSKVTEALTGSNSKDKNTMVQILREGIEKNDLSKANEFLTYIEERNTVSLNDIDDNDKIIEFIERKKEDNIFILKKGDIEDYLPEGIKKHELGKIIEHVKIETFIPSIVERKDTESQIEIDQILFSILGIPFEKRDELYEKIKELSTMKGMF